MPGPHYHLRTRPQRVEGILPGSLDHQILLALRPGGVTSEQVYARFQSPSQAMCNLKRAGLIETPPNGQKGKPVRLTDAGLRIVDPDGPLARRNSLIDYLPSLS